MIPGITTYSQISRLSVSADDSVAVGKIDVKYYKIPANIALDSLKYMYNEIKDLKMENSAWKLDFMLKVALPLKSSLSVRSGHMQMLQHGEYPGKLTIPFLPMIDIDPSDMTCIYSSLHFICGSFRICGTKAVITFDQHCIEQPSLL